VTCGRHALQGLQLNCIRVQHTLSHASGGCRAPLMCVGSYDACTTRFDIALVAVSSSGLLRYQNTYRWQSCELLFLYEMAMADNSITACAPMVSMPS
jgi:hypothetical protein